MVSEQDKLIRSLPPEISALGAPEQIHPVRPWVVWLVRMFALACLAAAAVFLGVLADRVPATRRHAAAMLLGGVAFATTALVLTGMAFSLRSFAYLVFRDALVQVFGGGWTIFRWDEIKEVFEQPIGARSRFRIVLADGRLKTIFPLVKNQHALGRIIVTRVSERVVPQTLRLLRTGGTVSVGGLSLSAEPTPCPCGRAERRVIPLDRRVEPTTRTQNVEPKG